MARFVGAAEPLSKPGFEAAVAALGAGMAELVAVLKVESRSCGFLPNRRRTFGRPPRHQQPAGRRLRGQRT